MTDNAYKLDGTRYRTAYKRDGTRYPRPVPATLDEAGETLLTSAKETIAKYDPNGTAFKIAFISDLHRTHEGLTYDEKEVDDSYSIHLLSRLCDEIPFDAVICGGDIVNATPVNEDYVQQNMRDVVADFDDYLPFTNLFATFGNHDKKYKRSGYTAALNTNKWLHDLYDHIQQDGDGVELHYLTDPNPPSEDDPNLTNFYVDFPKKHIRLIFINQYDAVDQNSSWGADEALSESATGTPGVHTHGTTVWKSALPSTAEDIATWTVGIVYHGADGSNTSNLGFSNWNYLDLQNTMEDYADSGGTIFGAFAGHWHKYDAMTILPCLNVSHTAQAYAIPTQIGLSTAYCFSVVVLDETGLFRVIRVGRSADVWPFHVYKKSAQNGLLMNGSIQNPKPFCVYNGNMVRFDRRDNAYCYGINFTDISKNTTASGGRIDYVTPDTANVLFSASAGDVIKTEIKFSTDTGATRNFKIFSPQKTLIPVSAAAAGTTVTNEITLDADTDFTAIGMYWYGNTQATTREPLAFELNVYKNGVLLTRGG